MGLIHPITWKRREDERERLPARREQPKRISWLLSPSYFATSQEGVFGIYNSVGGVSQTGAYRVQNDIEGYIAYIGVDALPDLTLAPSQYSASLPMVIALTPVSGSGDPLLDEDGTPLLDEDGAPLLDETGGSGTATYHVLIRRRDSYGLQSQNQHCTVFVVSWPSGDLVMPPLAPPQELSLFQRPGGMIRILAVYPGFGTDPFPATSWKVWVKSTVPIPVGSSGTPLLDEDGTPLLDEDGTPLLDEGGSPADTPVLVTGATGKLLVATVGPFSAGTWYVMVGLYRAADDYLSPTIYATVEISGTPDEVVAVPGGFDGI